MWNESHAGVGGGEFSRVTEVAGHENHAYLDRGGVPHSGSLNDGGDHSGKHATNAACRQKERAAEGSRPKRERIHSIDGLKVLALLSIFFWHAAPGYFQGWPDLGGRACELFFVCSGMLEGLRLFGGDSDAIPRTGQFFWKKLKGVYPLHLLMFLAALGLAALGVFNEWTLPKDWFAAIMNLALLQAWFPKIYFSFNGVSWFLSALLFCYLLTPVMARGSAELMRRIGSPRARAATLAIITSVLLAANAGYEIAFGSGVPLVTPHVFPPVRFLQYASAFAIGGLLKMGGGRGGEKARTFLKSTAIEVLVGVLYVLTVVLTDAVKPAAERTPCVLAAIMVVAALIKCRGEISRLLSARVFRRGAVIELPFFMSHQICIRVVFGLVLPASLAVHKRTWLALGLCTAFALTVAFSVAWVALGRRLSGRGRYGDR